MINGATTGWNPPPHFPMATWYFCDASVQRIFKHFPSHPILFPNPFRQRQISENLEIHLGGERTHTFCRAEMSEFLLLCSFYVNSMLCQGGREVEEFFWLHTFLGKNQSTKCFMGNQRHRKEKQWQPASNLWQKGQVKINSHGLSEVVRLFNH